MEDNKVTREEFMRFEECRQSGETNMWDTPMVGFLADLGRDEILYIMQNYTELKNEYMGTEVAEDIGEEDEDIDE